MTVNSLSTERFLAGVFGSPMLDEYCQLRGLPAPTGPVLTGARSISSLARCWESGLHGLPGELLSRVMAELEAVAGLAGHQGNAHLLEASGADGLPPADVTPGAPLALWFLLRQPALFDEVHRHHLYRDPDVWRAARVKPSARPADPDDAAARLAHCLGTISRLGPREWHVSAHRLPQGAAFVAVSTRTGAGMPLTPDRPLCADRLEFVHHQAEGTVLLQPGLGPEQTVRELLEAFASCVGAGLPLPGPAFDLQRLRWPVHLPPDAPDLEAARLKTLHLRYPGREGSRLLVLETVDTDRAGAIEEMVARHVPEETLLELTVDHAVVQLRLADGEARHNHLVRLWPRFCDPGRGALGLRALACVRRWGL